MLLPLPFSPLLHFHKYPGLKLLDAPWENWERGVKGKGGGEMGLWLHEEDVLETSMIVSSHVQYIH